jgi:hypothetical protein
MLKLLGTLTTIALIASFLGIVQINFLVNLDRFNEVRNDILPYLHQYSEREKN